MKMNKAILFDLDGTLLPMDTEKFAETYVKSLAKSMATYIHPDVFVKSLWAGTNAMIENKNPRKKNEDVFIDTFIPAAGVEKETVWPALNAYYEEEFPKLSYLTKPDRSARDLVLEAKNQGYKIAVATNPLFPKRAIEHRMAWAGIDDIPFDFITYYENSYFTKPHVEYYQDVSSSLNLAPVECIMAGNDAQEDLAASTAGMKTFFVTGHEIDRGEGGYYADDRGTLRELYEKLRDKEGIFSDC
ncbi:Phosphoglycolate phosphatase, HAD superfamily [Salisediminibacterium halotolerans]|uniref:Phosphoglycolate phosphatase, HAD superfamily n=2 Tax=Salisediminibacterium halotolerans TaxID=517425 RepID=A0A1H9WSG7_9BACI|nr:Phosphoglycolate phosphatase, HAD superfamily [Salisediminibacterium haloalkalitolerans]